MEKKREIVQYRERLDKTLASPDLTNEEKLKNIVRNQFLSSYSEQAIEGYYIPYFHSHSPRQQCYLLHASIV